MSNATYLAICNNIYDLTKRPDLLAETALAVRKATMKFHLADMWKNDLATAIITLPVLSPIGDVSFRYSLDLTQTSDYPLMRKVSEIVEYNTVPTGYETHFKELDADRIMDHYMLEEINYWYQVGRQVSLRCNKLLTQLKVIYYRYPDVTTAVFNSWVAEQFPDFIVCEAAAQIFATIGKDTEAARYASMFTGPDGNSGNLQLLRISEI